MSDEVELTGDEAAAANRITAIDAELDAVERRARESVVLGLHGSGAAMMTNLVQTSADERHAALLAERAEVVERLRREVGDTEAQGSSGPSKAEPGGAAAHRSELGDPTMPAVSPGQLRRGWRESDPYHGYRDRAPKRCPRPGSVGPRPICRR